MKLTAFFMLLAGFTASAGSYSQTVTISEKNAPIEKVFRIIEDQTGYVFFYDYSLPGRAKKVSIQAKNVSLTEVLRLCFKDQPLTYTVVGRTIVVKLKKEELSYAGNRELLPIPPTVDIAGIVTDRDGLPLSGASVKVKGTNQGTTADKKGHFSLRNINEKAILVVSFVGYETKEVSINNARTIVIQLEQSENSLNETVIIGYGTTTKKTKTGSVSSITAKEIARQPVANPLNALQGRIAGAIITQSNGLPGSRVTIQIRGINSIDPTGSGTQPLYIVDGVPFNIYDNSAPVTNDLNSRGQFAAAGGLSPFSVINPAEIERIDILKDADATAIYGTRGANGVVLITTKKGKAGKTKLDINLYKGAGKVGHFIPMMNRQQYLAMRREAFANDGITPTPANAPDLLLWDTSGYTDWQKKYLGGTAGIMDAQATISGGDHRTRFLFNAGYHRETPVFPGNFKDERVSTRLNVEHNSMDKRFNANVSVNYSFNKTNLLGEDLSIYYNLPPNLPIYNPDGSLFWDANFENPEAYLFEKYFGNTHNLMTSSILRYTVLPGLDVKASFGFNRVQLEQNTQMPAISKNPFDDALTHSAAFASIDQKSYIFEPQATYTRNIFQGKLSALVGGTFQSTLNTSLRTSGDNYSTTALLGSISGAGSFDPPRHSYTLYRYNSIFGRLTYNWKTKYLLNAVLRRDGSSRFGPGKKFGTFWSVGLGWVFSNESFVRNVSFLSFGKLRASYGVTGNDQIQDYLYRTFFTNRGTYQNGAALAPSRVENPLLQWQTTYKLEFGADLAFNNNRIQLTANYYRNRTPNQLGYLSLSSQAGFNSYSANFDALIQNTGVEFELRTENINTRDFRWSTSFNLTIPRTKLLDASPSYFFYNKSVLGQPLSVVFRYSYQGVDPATGRAMYRDITKDSLTFTPNFSLDRIPIGYSAPKLYGGLNNIISYKQFELSFFFQFQGQEGNIRPNSIPGVLSRGNQTTLWLHRWRKPGDANVMPRYTTGTAIYSGYSSSDALWGDASFIRLRTVNLSYAMPKSLISKLKVTNARIYLQAQNVWWSSKNKYVYDPETGTAMPPLRVLTAGINVSL